MMKQTKKILIAEDRPDSRRLLEDLLSVLDSVGVKTLIARDGAEAYEVAEKEHPELILLDIMMPKMSGVDVCRKIKEDPELKDIYIIMVTAKFQEEDKKEAILAGADEYMTKPYDVSELLKRVRSALELTI